MKKIFCAALLSGVLFSAQPKPVYAYCCDGGSVTSMAFLAGMGILTEGMAEIILAVNGQGTGIQGGIQALGVSVATALDSSAEHVAMSIAKQMDESRAAEFKVQQALNMKFGLGLSICCGSGDGIAAGGETGNILRADITENAAQKNKYENGRKAQNMKNFLQQKYAPVDEKGQVTGPEGAAPLAIIEPKNGTYTKKELEAALNVFGPLADPFPSTIQTNLSPEAQKDYDAMNQQRDWLLKAQRHAPLADWIAFHAPTMPMQEWFDAMSAETGLHQDIKLEDGMMSPRMYNEFSRDMFLSVYAQSERLKLNEKGLLQELVKVSAHQYLAEVETLTTLKRISVQLALNDPSILQQMDEYLSAFKTQLNTGK